MLFVLCYYDDCCLSSGLSKLISLSSVLFDAFYDSLFGFEDLTSLDSSLLLPLFPFGFISCFKLFYWVATEVWLAFTGVLLSAGFLAENELAQFCLELFFPIVFDSHSLLFYISLFPLLLPLLEVLFPCLFSAVLSISTWLGNEDCANSGLSLPFYLLFSFSSSKISYT